MNSALIQPNLQKNKNTNTIQIILQTAEAFPVFLQSQYYPDIKNRQGPNKKEII